MAKNFFVKPLLPPGYCLGRFPLLDFSIEIMRPWFLSLPTAAFHRVRHRRQISASRSPRKRNLSSRRNKGLRSQRNKGLRSQRNKGLRIEARRFAGRLECFLVFWGIFGILAWGSCCDFVVFLYGSTLLLPCFCFRLILGQVVPSLHSNSGYPRSKHHETRIMPNINGKAGRIKCEKHQSLKIKSRPLEH